VDDNGCLPLHLACEIGKEWIEGGVRAVHAAFPDAIHRAEENARGWLPLHLAANAPQASLELIAKLIELHADAANAPDAQGRYPLHLACQSGKSWLGGVEALFEAAPSVMGTPDDAGLLPFHLAALRYCRHHGADAVSCEEQCYDDDSIMSKEELQAQDAREAASLDILFQLLRADPTVVPAAMDGDGVSEA
jgi:hypothetical protein